MKIHNYLIADRCVRVHLVAALRALEASGGAIKPWAISSIEALPRIVDEATRREARSAAFNAAATTGPASPDDRQNALWYAARMAAMATERFGCSTARDYAVSAAANLALGLSLRAGDRSAETASLRLRSDLDAEYRRASDAEDHEVAKIAIAEAVRS